MHLPTPNRAFILRYKWTFELLAIFPVLLTSGMGAVKVYQQLASANERLGTSDGGSVSYSGLYWILAGVIASVGVMLLRVYVAKQESASANSKESPQDLRGCCEMLLTMTQHSCAAHTCEKVRVSFRNSGAVDSRRRRDILAQSEGA